MAGLGEARWVDGSVLDGWRSEEQGLWGRTRRGILRGQPESGDWGVKCLPICLPALQVAEIQKIELSVILSVVDGVHVLGEVEVVCICFSPPPTSLWTPPIPAEPLPNAPTALPLGSGVRCSHIEQHRSQRSHLGQEMGSFLVGEGDGE